MMRILTQDKDFNYEEPKMEYDKKTGDVKIFDTKAKKQKILRNLDDLEREKQTLYKQLKIEKKEQDAIKTGEFDGDAEVLGEKMALMMKKFKDDNLGVDPSKIAVFSRDWFRVDIGLIIQRPPIFMQLRQREMDFMKMRS